MAILNLTPDSFYDGGRYTGVDSVLRDAEEKLKQGAAILDLGAASSRQGAPVISEEEEWRRLKDVLIAVRSSFPDTLISVDTCRALIAEKSAGLGADLINDISGGELDPDMEDTMVRLQIPYILMHMKGNPQNMQLHPDYKNVVEDVLDFFQKKIGSLKSKGFNKIILDPGFGFGKNLEHNYQLLKSLRRFTELGYPVLAGISRKSIVNKVIGTNPVTALNGTTVLNTLALLNGVKLLRVHDVQEAKQAIELVSYYHNV